MVQMNCHNRPSFFRDVRFNLCRIDAQSFWVDID